jgi:sec-independent protein translocase protein TatA
MGLGGVSGWQLIILLLIVALLFGGKRLRSAGSDLGSALRSFRQGMNEVEGSETDDAPRPSLQQTVKKSSDPS